MNAAKPLEINAFLQTNGNEECNTWCACLISIARPLGRGGYPRVGVPAFVPGIAKRRSHIGSGTIQNRTDVSGHQNLGTSLKKSHCILSYPMRRRRRPRAGEWRTSCSGDRWWGSRSRPAARGRSRSALSSPSRRRSSPTTVWYFLPPTRLLTRSACTLSCRSRGAR